MTHWKDLKSLRDAIIAAENSLHTAKQILGMMLGNHKNSDNISFSTEWLQQYSDNEFHIVEGVFTGDSMLGADGNTYPVPHNYASKSLLVQGSRLKALISQNGKINYKIIEEIPFESTIWMVTKAWDRYQITTDKKSYNVLTAAITFHKVSIGDTVNVRIPKGKDATYAVIENMIPKN